MSQEVTNSMEHEDIRNRLTVIETKLDLVLDRYDKDIEQLKAAQGKQSLISATMSALGISLVFLAKYLFKTKGG